MPAMQTAMYGPLLEAMRSMRFSLPRFANGGSVSSDNSRKMTLVQHFHGSEARSMQNPATLRWHSRFAFRG
jgi:hypothetical protein